MLKKIVAFLLPVMMLAGCNVEEFNDSNIEHNEYSEFRACMEDWSGETKVLLDSDLKVLWEEQDVIAVFNKSNEIKIYGLTEGADSQNGTFSFQRSATQPESPVEFEQNIAIFPSNDSYLISNQADQIHNVLIPMVQDYYTECFDKNAFPMLAVSDDNNIKFKNAASLIRIQLKGTEKIKSLVLNNDAYDISGYFTLSYDAEGLPKLNVQLDHSNNASAYRTIKLNCGDEGVQLDPHHPTSFYFSVNPGEFTKGFSVIVNDASGKSNTYTSSKSFVLERNQVLKMPVISYAADEMHESSPSLDEIWVKTVDGLQPKDISIDVEIVSASKVSDTEFWKYIMPRSTLENGILMEVPSKVFKGHDEITHVKLPSCVESMRAYAFTDCINLKAIDLSSFKNMSGSVFENCTALESVILPQTKEYTRVEPYTLKGCGNLRRLDIPSNIKELAGYAIYDCKGLEELVLHEGLERISYCAVGYGWNNWENKVMKTLTLPGTITLLGANAFSGLTGLETITVLPNKNKIEFAGSSFELCSNVKDFWFYPAPVEGSKVDDIFFTLMRNYTLHLNPAWENVDPKPNWLTMCEDPDYSITIQYDAVPANL